ncbi:MAG: hypothetical protein AAF417_18915 [Pseudomonadota bacterium]
MKTVCSLLITLVTVAAPISASSNPIRIEAEDMALTTYRLEDLSSASNGSVINLKGPGSSGIAESAFPGPSGSYDVFVAYHDESDGTAELTLALGGVDVETWELAERTGEGQPVERNFRLRQIAIGRSVNRNDAIEVRGTQGRWDNANVDYIEFVPTAPQNSLGFAVVAATGGDYVNPVDAMQNLSAGDRWCRLDPADDNPCVLTIEPGVYQLNSTLRIPGGTTVVGAGPTLTKLLSLVNTGIAVRMRNTGSAGVAILKDLSVDHTNNNSILTNIVRLDASTAGIVDNVAMTGTGPNVVVGLEARATGATLEVRDSRVNLGSGGSSFGIIGTRLTIEGSSIAVDGDAGGVGVSIRTNTTDGNVLSVNESSVFATGGTSPVGIAANNPASTVRIANSRIHVEDGTNAGNGIRLGGPLTTNELSNVHIVVEGIASGSTGGISFLNSSVDTESRMRNVTVRATGGGERNDALSLSLLSGNLDIVDSDFVAENRLGFNVGVSFTSSPGRLRVRNSRFGGDLTAFSVASSDGSNIEFSFTEFDGPFVVISNNNPTLSCAAVIDENNVFYPDSCPP